MIIGRREDYIEKIRRACAAWQRQDVSIQLATQGSSIFITALDCILELTGIANWQDVTHWEDFPDEVFVTLYEYVSNRDADLKRKILAYFERLNPRAKATAELQPTLFD